MKKTLVALAVAAFASSASALTVYEADGSKVDFDGSIRLRLDKGDSKVDKAKKTEKHSNLHNDGSRFGVRMKHNIADDFYALGRVEFRFNSGASGTDQFGDLYAHRAYVGFGSKQFGELTFGRQVLIGDDIAQAGFDNAYDTFDGTLAASGKAAVRYDYKGIEGLHLGVDYRFAEKRSTDSSIADAKDAVGKAYLNLLYAQKKGIQKEIAEAEKELKKAEEKVAGLVKSEIPTGELKSGYGIGALYDFKVAEGQTATVAAGYSRDNYVTGNSTKSHKDAWQAGAKYSINALTLAADYAGAFKKSGDNKERFNGFRVGAKYAVTPAVAVYGNYGHGVAKTKANNVTTKKVSADKFMLGAEYKVHKNVFTYLEGGLAKTKTTTTTTSKTTEKDIGVGLRVNW